MSVLYQILIVIGAIGLAVFVGWLVFTYVKKQIRTKESNKRTLNLALLQVRVQKDVDEEEKKKSPADVIAIAEHLFSSFYSIYSGDWNAKIYGETYLGIEIVADEGKIDFYVVVPKDLVELVRKQMNAQLPDAIIEESEGYNIFRDDSKIEAVSLDLNKSYVFPIKTYEEMKSDPLNNITNALSKLSDDEGAAIQFMMRPVAPSWSDKSKIVASNIQEGKPAKARSGVMLVLGWISDALTFLMQNLSNTASNNQDKYNEQNKRKELTETQKELVKSIEEKAGKPGFETKIRLISSSTTEATARANMANIFSAFSQFLLPDRNGFKRSKETKDKVLKDYIFRRFIDDSKVLLSTKELATVVHFPNHHVDTPNINWLLAKRAPLPPDAPTEGIVLGKNVFRGVTKDVHMEHMDRRRHVYILGRTGGGKSNFMFNMIRQDIQNGKGVCVIDPHGDLAERVLLHIPRERADDVIYFDPGGDLQMPMGLNIFESNSEEEKELRAMSALNIMIKMFGEEMFGPRLQDYFRNACLTLMADDENPGTIIDLVNLFTDEEYQMDKVIKLKNPTVKSWWIKVFGAMHEREKAEIIPYFAAKFGQFTTNSVVRNTLGQSKSAFNIRKVMDEGKILIANLSKGKLGEINSNLIGMILSEEITMSALSRVDTPEEQRRDFYLYVDEFQNFATKTFSTILSEARKYALNLIIAHQFIDQLSVSGKEEIRDAVFGNCGTYVIFRTSAKDAEFLENEFRPTFTREDIANIDKYVAYVKLLIDGTASKPFSMSLGYHNNPNVELGEAVRQLSRLKFGREKAEVDEEIRKRLRLLG